MRLTLGVQHGVAGSVAHQAFGVAIGQSSFHPHPDPPPPRGGSHSPLPRVQPRGQVPLHLHEIGFAGVHHVPCVVVVVLDAREHVGRRVELRD
jgi:hypothetical protein